MKKLMISVCLVVLWVSPLSSDERATDILLGFFKAFIREENKVVILAAYRELELRAEGSGSGDLQDLKLGDMIEAKVYRDEEGLVLVSLINHGMPAGGPDLDSIIMEYAKRRRAVAGKSEQQLP